MPGTNCTHVWKVDDQCANLIDLLRIHKILSKDQEDGKLTQEGLHEHYLLLCALMGDRSHVHWRHIISGLRIV